MYKKGFISSDCGDIIITGLPDRKFFYDIFVTEKNVFSFSQFTEFEYIIKPPQKLNDYLDVDSNFFLKFPNFKNHQPVNLKTYAAPPTYCQFSTNNDLKEIGYNIPDKYYDDDFVNIAKKFNLLPYNEIENLISSSTQLFIVIHHRYGSSIDNLKNICSKFPSEILKIIFCSNVSEIEKEFRKLQNFLIINDLRTYATILKDQRCKLLISEWSGGGQISQYFLGPQGHVWYYYDSYPDIYNFTMTHKIWEINSKLGSYFNCWDFKCISGCNISHFPNLDSLLNYRI